MSLNIQAKTDYSNYIANSLPGKSQSSLSSLTNAVTNSSDSSISALFTGTSSMSSLTNTMMGAGSGNSVISDYAAIKNGSYGKLMKAYYKEVADTDSSTDTGKTETGKTESEDSTDKKADTSASTVTGSMFDKYL